MASVTSDGASAMQGAAKRLVGDENDSNWCFCHLLNLAVEDLLKENRWSAEIVQR